MLHTFECDLNRKLIVHESHMIIDGMSWISESNAHSKAFVG